MKKPLRFFYNRKTIAFLLMLAAGIVYYNKNFKPIDGWEQEWREEEEGEENPAEALGPIDWWGSMRSYPNPNGEISAAAYLEAFEHMKQMPVAKTNSDPRARAQALSPWVALGPFNFSGRILSLGFHPTNANIMWAGSVGGGLWKTTTGGIGGPGGINWTQVQTGWPVSSVPAIAVNPSNANEIYIGTGEVYNTGSNTGFPGQNIRTFRGSYGIGILKTIDGGVTWTQSLPLTNSLVKGVQDILIDPTNPANVFAATSDGVYRSTNFGGSWTLIHNIILAMDICFAPGNPDVLYVGCGDFGSAGSGLYKSINARAATPIFTPQTGTGLPSPINGAIRLNICPTNANIIYASVGKIPGSANGTAAPSASATYGLYRSTNGGTSWNPIANQPILGGGLNYIQGQGWYAHDVLVGPRAADTIYVAEIDFMRSVDGGNNYTKITDWSDWDFAKKTIGPAQEGTSNVYTHADHHHIYFSPTDPTYQTIYVVTDGGVFRSTNRGSSWTGLNGGFNTTQIYHKMGMSATNPALMICGLQDNATLWYQGTTGCKRTTGGDGFYSIIDQTNDSICFGTYAYGTTYRGNGILNLGGTTSFANNPSAVTGFPSVENAAFVAPVVMAPSDHNRLYLGTINFKRSTNNGVSFANYGTNPLVNANAPIIYIGISKTFADSIYVATCPGGGANPRVYRSANGGLNFTNVTGAGLPNRYFTSLAVDPKNSRRVALTVGGFGATHVYFTSDAGATWNDITGTGGTALPDVPANVAMFDPTTPSTLYIGTDIGVFVAQNITTGATQPTWYSYNGGITDVIPVMDLQVAPNGKLRMGSFGKGLWENDMVTGSLPVTFESFGVTPSSNGNQLRWVIGTQENVSHYEVEYSKDGINFSSIATVQPLSGATHLTYNFTHKITNSAKGYYRIKAVDLDGEITYSQIEEVKPVTSGIVKIVAYPNPTTGTFKIRIPSQLNGTVELSMYDDMGRLVLSDRVQVSGTVEVPMDISRFASGNYQIICVNRSVQYVTRIVKK